MINLASGYGTFAVPPVALAAVQAALATAQSTQQPLASAPAGRPALRTALASRYQQRGAAGVQPEHVVITQGAKPALLAVLSELLGPGEEVLLPTPNWFGFGEIVRRAGGTLRALPLAAADGYDLTPAALRAALTPATRVLLLSNPNNPTGRVYSRANWAALLAVTHDFPHLWVLSDEIYEGIQFGPEPVPTLLALPGSHAQHVVVSGFSKSLALIGFGVGYVVAPTALAAAVATWQFATSAAVATLSQVAALAATTHADAIGKALVAQLQPRRTLLLEALAALPGPPLAVAPTGTYYVFADFTRWLDAALPPAEASAQLVQRLATAGVEVVDGATCGAPGFARISYAVPEADLRTALAQLASALREA